MRCRPCRPSHRPGVYLPQAGSTIALSPAVAALAAPLADPDLETLRQKSNELLAALRR
jgi:hypothetical protein